MRCARSLLWLLGGLLAQAAAAQERLPSFDELEAQGAVIGEIRVDTQDIFDLDDPRENNRVFRAANRLHVNTRPWVIRRLLLFKTGDRLSHRVIDETVRIIRSQSSVYDAQIRPVRYANGIVDLEVRTRDTWTLEPGVSLNRSGGKTTGSFRVKEGNLAGTGTSMALEREKQVERTGSHVQLAHEHLFDGWTSLSFDRASFSDGSSLSLAAARPFYSLDTRWAAGASFSRFDRTDSLYRNGDVIGDYRHAHRGGDAFAGWSPGRVGRWTQRFSAGVTYAEDTYVADPGRAPPVAIPANRTIAGPYLRHELIEDDFVEVTNRDRIQRPEYLAMGFQSSIQLGRSLAAFGATDQPWLLSASLGKGLRAGPGQLLGAASYAAQYGSALGDVRSLGTSLRYFAPQSRSFLLYLAGATDTVRTASAADELLLGGDSGLRGYPLRYQSGTRRAVFTAEERYYTDWYPLRLFRVGWAAYWDVGRAWGGEVPNATPGWLADVGFGLRILNARTSFGSVVHIDLAFPVHRTDPGIKARQLVVTGSSTF
jgi:hypothetical protein